MTTLVIAEKPSVASDIAAALGGFRKDGGYWQRDDMVIANALGHLVELQVDEGESRRRGFSGLPVIPAQFDLQVIEERREQYRGLERLLRSRDVDLVINACDAGREGELIFRLILEKAGCRLPVKRMWMQSMTQNSIREAFEQAIPGEEKESLYRAARCRSEADWLIGINGSRAVGAIFEMMMGRRESSSTGRVQTPTLGILVDHELAILNFEPQDFWEIHGTFKCAGGEYKGRWKGATKPPSDDQSEDEAEEAASRIFDKAKAQEVLARIEHSGVVSRVEETTKPKSSPPPYLFDLTSLQREANKLFKMSAKRTLDIAQSLYERHKVTTYPRTDSNRLPDDYVETAASVMQSMEGSRWGKLVKLVIDSEWVKPNKRIFDSSKVSDHFAIIPTGVISDRLDQDESKIYELIVRRFIAAFFPNAEFDITKRVTYIGDEPFHSGGSVLVAAGWMMVLGQFDDEGKQIGASNKVLAPVGERELPEIGQIEMKTGKTKAPGRYTEAKLLGAMATAGKLVEDEDLRAAMTDKGLGTPATRASIIETLKDDGMQRKPPKPKEPYVRVEDNFLVPTKKGMTLIQYLRKVGAEFLTSAQTTGEWEACLKMVEQGEFSPDDFMDNIRQTTSDLVEVLREQMQSIPGAAYEPIGAVCPRCSNGVEANRAGFKCQANCGFELARSIAQRQMTNDEMVKLLRGEKLENLKGFYSTSKKKEFGASLLLEGEEIKFDFSEQEQTLLPCKCPRCDGNIASLPALAKCVECDFKVWRELLKKKLTDTELTTLIKTGKIDMVKGFKSTNTGNKFDAGLKISTDGKVELVFQSR